MRAGRLLWTATLALSAIWLAGPASAQTPSVLHVQLEGEPITPVIAGFLDDAVDRASSLDAPLLVELDTPGGLDRSMRDIVKAFLTSRVPVIVYVPTGARAASAGAIIAFSATVVGMAPSATIGAATPVDLQGGEISEKIVNDAAAFAESVARARGRSVEFAVDTVRDGKAVPAPEALELGAIDLLATSTGELLDRIDGREVEVTGGAWLLETAGAMLVTDDLSAVQRVRQRLADPNLAFIFLSLATLAIIYELANPGIGAGGVTGVILLILAMFSLSVLPVNTAGLMLLVLSAGLFTAEVLTSGFGVFGVGGIIAMTLGGLFLFQGSVGVSLSILVPTVAVVAIGIFVAGRLTWRARQAPSATGAGQLIGATAAVRRSGDRLQVFAEGAWWSIRSDTRLNEGDTVKVTGVDGLVLVVEPAGVTQPEGGPA
ncbi:MAG TPA: nodulation protein NfeD [Actinomycetota bacterium]